MRDIKEMAVIKTDLTIVVRLIASSAACSSPNVQLV